MPQQNYLATVTIPHVNGIQKDAVQSAFAILDQDGSGMTVSTLTALLASFYNDGGAGRWNSLCHYLSGSLSRAANACAVKLYSLNGHLDGSAHGSPVGVGTFTLGATASGTNIAQQVAAVMTLRARQALSLAVEAPNLIPGEPNIRPRGRNSGRMYFGPLTTAALSGTSGTASPGVHTNCRDDLTIAAETLQDGLNAQGLAWGVWSRTNEGISVISSVHVDDSVDVIRRRKIAKTTQTTRVFAPVPDLALGA